MLFPLPATADLSNRTVFRMTGADRVRYLNGQVTNDIKALHQGAAALPAGAPARSCYACLTNAKGKLEADVFVTELLPAEDAFLIDADPSLRESLRARLEKYIIADDVQIEDVTDSFALFHVINGDPPETVSNRLRSGCRTDPQVQSPPLSHPPRPLPGERAGVRGSSETASPSSPGGGLLPAIAGTPDLFACSPSLRFGLPGTDCFVTAARREAALAALPPLAPPDLLEVLRIAHGIPRWGAELTPDILPPEAGLQARAISYTKGCYIGQEVLSRIKSVGRVNKQLVALVGERPSAATHSSPAGAAPAARTPPLQPGLALYTPIPEKASAIGMLTSCAFHPARGAPIALGYVKKDHAAPGTRVCAGTEDNPFAFRLEVAKTPLI